MPYLLRVLCASLWTQGICSNYRRAYWRFLGRIAWNWWRQPAKVWLGFTVLLSAHHFVMYARVVEDELERECAGLQPEELVPAGEMVTAISPALP